MLAPDAFNVAVLPAQTVFVFALMVTVGLALTLIKVETQPALNWPLL